MKPAQIHFDDDGAAHAPEHGDRYHPRSGSAVQAQQVFLAGNGLPQRWAGRGDFTILETGFGLGHNFLATWHAWRADPQRPARLHYVGVEGAPPTAADLALALRGSPWATLGAELLASWPPLIDGQHLVELEGGRVQLMLAWGEVGPTVQGLDLQADAFYLDGFAPDRNPAMWQPSLMQALARRAAAGASAASWTVARSVRDALRSAGFVVERGPASGEKRQTLCARLEPGFVMRLPPPRQRPPPRVLVVGAGLAGGWAAHALGRQGHDVTVFDRHEQPAQEASGNPAGLIHATVHADDGPHAQFSRAAALFAVQTLAPWVADGSLPGQLQGLLRLASRGQTTDHMRAELERHALPATLVQVLDRAEASSVSGTALPGPAWRFGPAGWVAPGPLVHRLLRGVDFRGGVAVASLVRDGPDWCLLDEAGRVIDRAPTVVLANAAAACTLWPQAGWPIGRSRGQLSLWRRPPAASPRLRCPVAGDGYALSLPDGALLFGASAAPGDEDPDVRSADHDFNLERLARLTGWQASDVAAAGLEGRVGWRAQTPDRLPLVGAVPAADAGAPTPLQARWMAREPGLFVLSGLGSRGLTWGPLAGRMLAAWVSGAPMPVPARLRDALDPGRWRLRGWRKAG